MFSISSPIMCLGNPTIYWKYNVFCGHPRWEAAWNDGIVECWNTGYKNRKKIYSKKMLYPHFMMMPIRHPFSAFVSENTRLLRENQYNYIRFDSLNLPFHYPRTMIPIFQNSSPAKDGICDFPIGAKPLPCVPLEKAIKKYDSE